MPNATENPSDLCQGQVLISLFIFILPTLPSCWTENSPRKAWVIWGPILLRVPLFTFPQHLKYHLSIQVLWCKNWLSSNWWLHVWLTTSNRCGPYQTFLGGEDYHPPDDKQDTSSDLPSKPSLSDWYDRFGIDDFIYSALADSYLFQVRVRFAKRQCEYDDTTKCTFTSVFDKTHIKSALTVLDTFERNVAIVNGTALPSHSSVAQSYKVMTD